MNDASLDPFKEIFMYLRKKSQPNIITIINISSISLCSEIKIFSKFYLFRGNQKK